MIRAGDASPMPFGAFLKEVKKTYQVLGASHRMTGRAQMVTAPMDNIPDLCDDPLPMAEASERIARALEMLSPDERLAVQLFVVDEMPAADVARTVGWRNAKAVYNRVYRALGTLGQGLERQGIRRGDL